jgi:hypothetical protein
MDWSAEALSVLVTGVLFLGIVVVGLTPLASLSPMSYVAFGAAGVVFIVSAFALARVQAVNYPPLMWVLPILPLLVIGVLLRDAVSARQATRQPVHATAIARPQDELPLAAAEVAPASALESNRGGEGSARDVAASHTARPNELARIAIDHPELRATIARNPLTPQSVLDWLSQQDDPAVAEALRERGLTGASY